MPIGRVRRRADWLSRRIGLEIMGARRARGWSQRELADRAGVSQSIVSRVERGWTGASVELLCHLTTALGLDFSARVYPADGVMVRDERQLQLIRMIAARAGPVWRASVEAPVSPDPSDHRAIDLVLGSGVEVCAIEVERDLRDFQAQFRADLLKRDVLAQRESRPVRFILALPENRRLRTLMRSFAPVISMTLPASSRHIWACIHSGRPVGADGLLWLPSVRSSVR